MCRVAIGQLRNTRCTESFRIPREEQFIGYMASGMKDCITVIHRQPSVFGGQVNQLLVRFLPIMIIIIIVVVIVITSAKQVCFCLALLVCLLR